MQFLVAAIMGGLLQIAASLAGRVLLALGIGFVAFTGMNTAIDGIYTQIKDSFSGLPSDVVAFLAWCWIDKAIATVFAAYTAAAGIKMAGSGTLKKMVIR